MKQNKDHSLDEFDLYHFRLHTIKFLLAIFPPYTAYRLRVYCFRSLGASIGKKSAIFSSPTFNGAGPFSNLVIGNNCRIGIGCYFDLNGKIMIQDRTIIGLQTMILTSPANANGQISLLRPDVSGDVVIGEGCWIGARSTILPGIKIGNGVVVAAGAVVMDDIADNTLVAGVPGKIIHQLDDCT